MPGHGSTLLFLVLLPDIASSPARAHFFFVSLSLSFILFVCVVSVDGCEQHISIDRSRLSRLLFRQNCSTALHGVDRITVQYIVKENADLAM